MRTSLPEEREKGCSSGRPGAAFLLHRHCLGTERESERPLNSKNNDSYLPTMNVVQPLKHPAILES
jgi:hypothetical protein